MGRIDVDNRSRFGPRPVDRAIAARARARHGVITREQLADLGLSMPAIDRRVALGRLHVVHHGVYAVGHTVLGAQSAWMAAVLACGPGAALSHASAAALWECSAASRRSSTSPPRPRRPHRAAGYRTLRFTDRQLTTRPDEVAQAIQAVLVDRRAV